MIGLPLAGKSHIGRLLTSKVENSVHISTGDIARRLIVDDIQQKEMEAKDLFPGEEQLRTELKKQIDDSAATCIFIDGFPRSTDQVKYLKETFFDLFPVVIDVSAGDLRTLAVRAKLRARDSRDFNQIEFENRLSLAMKNQGEVYQALTSCLIPHYTIISTASDESAYTQFQHISRFKL